MRRNRLGGNSFSSLDVFRVSLVESFADDANLKNLARIEESGDRAGVIDTSTADNMSAVVYARGVFWENTLMGCINSSSEKSPLPTVGVTRKDQVKMRIPQNGFVVVGIVAE